MTGKLLDNRAACHVPDNQPVIRPARLINREPAARHPSFARSPHERRREATLPAHPLRRNPTAAARVFAREPQEWTRPATFPLTTFRRDAPAAAQILARAYRERRGSAIRLAALRIQAPSRRPAFRPCRLVSDAKERPAAAASEARARPASRTRPIRLRPALKGSPPGQEYVARPRARDGFQRGPRDPLERSPTPFSDRLRSGPPGPRSASGTGRG